MNDKAAATVRRLARRGVTVVSDELAEQERRGREEMLAEARRELERSRLRLSALTDVRAAAASGSPRRRVRRAKTKAAKASRRRNRR